jgi:hypothetical protein
MATEPKCETIETVTDFQEESSSRRAEAEMIRAETEANVVADKVATGEIY